MLIPAIQVFQVRQVAGHNTGKIFAMKVLKKVGFCVMYQGDFCSGTVMESFSILNPWSNTFQRRERLSCQQLIKDSECWSNS